MKLPIVRRVRTKLWPDSSLGRKFTYVRSLSKTRIVKRISPHGAALLSLGDTSTERASRSGSLCAEAGTRAAAPFPAPLSPLPALFLRCAPDRFLLTKPNTSCTIEVPASLRSDGVQVHPGMPFGFIPDSAFGFAGIPT